MFSIIFSKYFFIFINAQLEGNAQPTKCWHLPLCLHLYVHMPIMHIYINTYSIIQMQDIRDA